MLNVIANLWGLNNNSNGNGSANASPIAKKKKRKNHHKKNKADVKNIDVKNSNSNSNDDDDDDNDGDDNDNDINFIARKNTTTVNSNDDDIDDLYKADIKDVSHQIIEVVRALSKKDYRCVNKDVTELFSDKYVSDIITYMFEGGYEYDNPEAIFNTIVDNNHHIFYDNDDKHNNVDINNSTIVDNAIEKFDDINLSPIIKDSVINKNDPIKPMDDVVTKSPNSISTDHYLTFLSQLDDDRIPNQLELLVINSNMEENLHILCAWFENVSTIPSNIQKTKDSIFLKSKALETILESFFSLPECFKTEMIKAFFIKLLKLLFTTSSSAGVASLGNFLVNNNNDVSSIVNDIVLHIETLSSQINNMSSHYSSTDGRRKAAHFIGIKMGQIIRNLVVRIKNNSPKKNDEASISKLLDGVTINVSKLMGHAKRLDNTASVKEKFDAREVGHEIVGMFLSSLEEMRKEIAKSSRNMPDSVEAKVVPIEDERTLEMLLLEYSGENMSSLISKLSQKSEVKSNLDNLRAEKERKVSNLKTDSMRLNARVNELKLEQQALLNKINNIDNEINEILGATKVLDNKIQEVNIDFEKEMNLLAQNQSQKGIISAVQLQESVSKVVDNIKTMENSFNRVFLFSSDDKSKNLATMNLNNEYNKWLHNSLEPLGSYMLAESICVRFLADRIIQNMNMMETLKVEKDNFIKLKMNSMANNLQSKIKDVEIGIEEDRNALATIQTVITQTLFRFVQSFTVNSFNFDTTTKLIIPSEPLSTIIKALQEAGVNIKSELSSFFTASVSSSPR